MPDWWGDGIDVTEDSVIWVNGETQGHNGQGEIVSSPEPTGEEETLKGELLKMLQEGGIDKLKQLLGDKLFVEDVPEQETDDSGLPDELPDDGSDDFLDTP